MPDYPTPQRYAARFDQLPLLLAAARDHCRSAGFGPDATRRVELVLEEAFSNSIRHGYGGESGQPVWLNAIILTDGLRFVFQDAAAPFDPISGAALPSDERPGGVGRLLIARLPQHAEYAYIDGRNTLTLEFAGKE